MSFYPTLVRARHRHARRLHAIDNPFLASALRSGRVRQDDPTMLPAQAEQAGAFRGYYLRTADGQNHWLGESLTAARANFKPAADRFLTAANGYDYDVVSYNVGTRSARRQYANRMYGGFGYGGWYDPWVSA